MIDLSSISRQSLIAAHGNIAMDPSGKAALAIYNLIFDKSDDTARPYQREITLDVLENEILNHIRDERTVKEDIDSMTIRKTDIIGR